MPRCCPPAFLPLFALLGCSITVAVEGGSQGDGSETAGGPSSSGDPGVEGGDPATPTTGEAPESTTGPDPTTGDASTSGTSTGDTGAASTGAAPAVCGDGVVQEGESCDDGFAANKDENLCTSSCQLARCGDGHIQTGNGEACDDGANNAREPKYNGCSAVCQRGPHCGDGIVQPEGGEECDPQGPGDTSNCAGMCSFAPRIVFLTSESFTGNMGGLAGADKRCNQLAAQSLDLDGSFRAWLLVDGQSLLDRFPEFGDAKLSWNFTSAGNELLAHSFAQLVAEGPKGALVYTEKGAVLAQKYVWTNITSDGLAAGGDCGQWTSAGASKALVGHSGFSPDQGPEAEQWHEKRLWTDLAAQKLACTNSVHLYCVQVAG